MLKLQNIEVTFGQRKILQDLNLQVAVGEFVVIIGSNGSGKSTLFNLIGGSLKPDRGAVQIANENVTQKPPHARAKAVSKVMQDPRVGTMEQMTLEENMRFAFLRGESKGVLSGFLPQNNKKRRFFFAEKLALLEMGLENRLDELAGNLSGGERQALSLIMALCTSSSLLLLDEITAALDPKIAEGVMQIAAKLIREEKRTTLMITHNMSDALRFGDRIVLLSQGRIVKEFLPKDKQGLTSQALAALFTL